MAKKKNKSRNEFDSLIKVQLKTNIDDKLVKLANKLTQNEFIEPAFKSVYDDNRIFNAYKTGSNFGTLKHSAINKTKTKDRGTLNRAVLAALGKGWKRQYNKIQSGVANSPWWVEQKQVQKQRAAIAPYNKKAGQLIESRLKGITGESGKASTVFKVKNGNPKFRVRYTSPALYTGFFRESVYRDFMNKSKRYVDVQQSLLVTGYEIDLTRFPKAFNSSQSYVSFFIQKLMADGVISSPEEFFSMDDATKNEIALLMIDMMNNSLKPEVATKLNILMEHLFDYKRS